MQISTLRPQVYEKAQHPMRRSLLPANVLKIIEKLSGAGYDAYVVGGCVRDKLFGIQPKDFDVATNAKPEEIKQLFSNCRLIGRRFRLAHLYFGREIIEVATFRGPHTEDNDDAKKCESGMLTRDNVFGSIEEDAARRDFSFNAMYFDPLKEEILDFADGMQAIACRSIRMIGEPSQRIAEDPVRMIRAIRFSAKLGCDIDENLKQAIKMNGDSLNKVSAARLFEEINKMFIAGYGLKTFEILLTYQIMQVLFPLWKTHSEGSGSKELQITRQMLLNTDERVNSGARTTPAFLYATILWYLLEERADQLMQEGGLGRYDAINIAGVETLQAQLQRIMIPKRFSVGMREIWSLQYRLHNRSGSRPFQLINHPRFRAAYDFMLLRAYVEGGSLQELADWWTKFQQASTSERKDMLIPQRRRRHKRKKKQRS